MVRIATMRCGCFADPVACSEDDGNGLGANDTGKVVNDTVLTETIAETRDLLSSGRFWMALLGAGLIIGLTGPFGTYDALPLLVRIGYWLVVISTTFLLGHVISFATASWAEDRGFGAYVSIGIGALSASVPVTMLLAGVHTVMFEASFWADVLRLLPYVVVIAAAVALFLEAVAVGNAQPAPRADVSPEPAWLNQLPAHLGKNLILLQAQDHYVRAVTDRGETLIRAKLQDASDQLGDFGFRIHRSWWVARNAVHALQYRKGTPVLVLRNGTQLPVGRTYRRSVRDALR